MVSTLHGEAVAELVRRHQASVRGYLGYLGCPEVLIDDLVQDVFLSVLSSGFEDRGHASTRAFLRTVARNLLYKELRREERAPLLADPEGVERAWVAFERDDDGRGYLEALRACVLGLTRRAREVLALRYEACLQRAAIADRLALTEAGVKTLLARSRKRLRACIERRLWKEAP